MNEPLSVALFLPAGAAFHDPDPLVTAARDVELVPAMQSDTGGVVGWSDGAFDALHHAAENPELPRLVIASAVFPEDPPVDLASVTAKTLLLFGADDPATGSSHGRRWQQALPNARLEMVPGQGADLLAPMWHRVMSFLAPRRKAP